jgi:hypothetical protein
VAKSPTIRAPNADRAVARLTGARLCYGKAVRQGDYAVVPVASVRGAGGYGFGRPGAGSEGDEGGGGGGALTGRPVGYIEIGPDGTRFERIEGGWRGRSAAFALGAGAGAVVGAGLLATGVGGFVAGRRASAVVGSLRRRRRAASLSLPRWRGR